MVSHVKKTVVDELHKQARINFKRRHYVQKKIGQVLQIDLVQMSNYKDDNRGYQYMLTAIDTFSKYAFAEPLKNKSGPEVTKAFEKILLSYKFAKDIRLICSDAGKEFYNKDFQALLKKHGIKHYQTHTKIKAGIVERFNRTLKNLCWRHFGYTGTYKWLTVLPQLIHTYNHTKHSTIKMQPAKVDKRHERNLLINVYNNNMKFLRTTDLKVNDYVRISDVSGTFRKGYLPQWSVGIYKIHKVVKSDPLTFKLLDFYDRPLARGFYREELQKVKYPHVYLVEKVLKKEGGRAYVKWLGYDNRYNSWIDEADIVWTRTHCRTFKELADNNNKGEISPSQIIEKNYYNSLAQTYLTFLFIFYSTQLCFSSSSSS